MQPPLGFDIGAFAATTVAWGVKAVKGLSVVGRDLERGFAAIPHAGATATGDDVARASAAAMNRLSLEGGFAADGGTDLYKLAGNFAGITVEGRRVGWPRGVVDKFMRTSGSGKNRFQQIIDAWGGDERGVFDLVRQVLESVPGRVGRRAGTYEYILETGGRGMRIVTTGHRPYGLITAVPYFV